PSSPLTSQTITSATSGPYATPTSSGPGPQADARPIESIRPSPSDLEDAGRPGRGRGQKVRPWPGSERQAVAGAVGGQLVAEAATAPVEAGHDRADGGAHDLGDLLVGVALDVGQVDGHPELFREVAQGPQDLRVGQPVQRLRFGRPD